MSMWTVPPKLSYALFVAGDARLGEDARPALNRVFEALAKGPPPAIELGAWMAEHGRMGTLPIATLREQIPSDVLSGASAGEVRLLDAATNGMLIAASDGAALDPRAPWGLLALAATLASASNGIVYDSGTLRIVPQWILQNPLDGFLLGSIKNHVSILSSTDAEGVQTTTTLGLNKYGLFELQLGGVPARAGNVGMLLAGLAQAVVDARPLVAGPWEVPLAFDVTRLHVSHAFGAELEKAGGSTRLTVTQLEGDDVYRYVGGAAGALDEDTIREAILALGIGSDEDEAISTALAQARRIARNRLSEARDAFARRALTQDVVLVKKGFRLPEDATEYAWLRVEDWSPARLSAVMTSGLSSAHLGIGDRVTLDDDEIVDWRVEHRTGEPLGNFSEEALRRLRSGE